MSKNCCKDKAAYFKVKDTHHANDITVSPSPSGETALFVLPVFQYQFNVINTRQLVLNYHAPPVLYDNPLYLKHKVLLI